MNIAFYGHSACAAPNHPESWLNLLCNKLNSKMTNYGSLQGSEERILYELKKTRLPKLDLAIIFHSYYSYTFIPHIDRDFNMKGLEKNGRVSYLWDNPVHQQFEEEWQQHSTNPIFSKFYEKYKTPENFKKCIEIYKDYFDHKDLQMNRYYGALIQIDQYITSKKINCIHVVDVEKNHIPNWFFFTSGVIDTEGMKIFRENNTINLKDPNGVTIEGNHKMALHFEEVIRNKFLNSNEARSRVALHLVTNQETEVQFPQPLQK